MFGNVSERRKSKYCGVLMKNCRKVNGEKYPNVSVTNINVALGQLFCRQWKTKFL